MIAARVRRGAVGLAVTIAGLEAFTRSGPVDPASLPPPSIVLATAARMLVDVEFLTALGGTLAAWVGGLTLATAISVPLGLVLGSSRRSYRAGIAAVELLRPIPSVALIPLAILLLGRGLDMKVILVAYASAWPILFNTIYGVRDVDPVTRETGRTFGLGAVAVLTTISLRSASPFIYTGIRISAAIALILAISTELIAGGGPGLGTWMLENSGAGVPRELLYGAIVVTGLLGLAINTALVLGERRLFAWHHRVRAET